MLKTRFADNKEEILNKVEILGRMGAVISNQVDASFDALNRFVDEEKGKDFGQHAILPDGNVPTSDQFFDWVLRKLEERNYKIETLEAKLKQAYIDLNYWKAQYNNKEIPKILKIAEEASK